MNVAAPARDLGIHDDTVRSYLPLLDFVTGIVFFTGDRPLPFGDRLLALPISLLWNGSPPPATI